MLTSGRESYVLTRYPKNFWTLKQTKFWIIFSGSTLFVGNTNVLRLEVRTLISWWGFQFCTRMYVRITTPKFHMKVRRQTNPWHHVLWATLRSIVLCCGQSVWTWKGCGQHWGHLARLKEPPQKFDQTRFVDQEGLLSHSPVFLFNETSENIFFQGRTARKSISNRSKILLHESQGKKWTPRPETFWGWYGSSICLFPERKLTTFFGGPWLKDINWSWK